MSSLTTNFWPSARAFAEAVQCPAVCFAEPQLRAMLPAVDRLGMPLVTSGQFAYVFKLNSPDGAQSLAVRCFRGFLGDREVRYRAIDAHLNACRLPALPRFKYLPAGALVSGRRFPVLLMEWVAGPTLDVYMGEVVGRREVLLHLADEWLKLMESLRAAGVAHGDLQHGNVIVERGRLRLVDLDGMFVPALAGLQSSEVGHQHYQHPSRGADFFSREVDNFSALVIYLSLLALAERPSLWAEHHDENLIFTRADFAEPNSSPLFAKVREIGAEHARLADVLAEAAKSPPEETPWVLDLAHVSSRLPAWMTAPAEVEVGGRTREVARAQVKVEEVPGVWSRGRERRTASVVTSNTVQTLFGAKPPSAVAARDPSDIYGNTLFYTVSSVGNTYAYVWWIPVHNLILEDVWASSYLTGAAGMLCSLMLFVAAFLLYGIFRAVYLAETGSPQAPVSVMPHVLAGTTAAAAAGSQPIFASAQSVLPPPQAVAAPPRPVVGNRSLQIYHLPACAWAGKIAPRNLAEFDSPASAANAGYRPCRVCAP
ncbi:MAG TPA: Ada metal-binding domain-containing protein [Pyrinomonadaceae bacterium]|nr:Ada metal-binding domain-containing protein [Pyrinomonadaceae bacterium]